MSLPTRPFDPAVYLDTSEAVAEYLEGALETGDQAFITDALGVVERRADIIRARLAKADAGGPFVTDEAMDEWPRSWGTDKELPKPKATFRTS